MTLFRLTLSALLFTLCLSACGQYGALYLPDKQQAKTTEAKINQAKTTGASPK